MPRVLVHDTSEEARVPSLRRKLLLFRYLPVLTGSRCKELARWARPLYTLFLVSDLGLPLILLFNLVAISSHFPLPPLGPGPFYFFKTLHPAFKKSVYRALTLDPYTRLCL